MFASVELIETKLRRNLHKLLRKNLPVGLHASPKCGKARFCGIGLVDWGGDSDPEPIGDVYVGENSEHYHAINRMLR